MALNSVLCLYYIGAASRDVIGDCFAYLELSI